MYPEPHSNCGYPKSAQGVKPFRHAQEPAVTTGTFSPRIPCAATLSFRLREISGPGLE